MFKYLNQQLGAGRVCTAAGVVTLGVCAVLLAPRTSPADGVGERRDITPANAVKDKRDPLAVKLEERLADDVQPLLKKYCYECHGNGKKKGGVKLDGPGDIASIMNTADDWETVVEVLNAKLMPPEKKPQPTAHELLTIQQWVDDAVEYYPADAKPDPGWYTIHRLNKSEYRNTLRDLLGIDPAEHDLAKDLPNDDTGYGFDNNADVLTMSPLQLDKFLTAAEQAVEIALGPKGDGKARTLRGLKPSNIGDTLDSGDVGLWANGTISAKHRFPGDGTYEIKVTAYGDEAQGKGPNVTVMVGKQEIKTVDITATPRSRAQVITLKAKVKKGTHTVAVRFNNDILVDRQDRNLYVRSITVAGPTGSGQGGGLHDEIFYIKPTIDDKGNRLPGADGKKRITESLAARRVLERFVTRAFRRPASAGETAALLRLYRDARTAGDDYEAALRLAMTATLVSPNFLYRPIANPRPNEKDFTYELNDYELASRLSYFLWSSMPDDRLLELAEQKKLRDPGVLRTQVRRMLMDPKSDALVENFAGQWLLLRKLDGLKMDKKKYPAFNAELRGAMKREAELFFADVVRNNRSVFDFLDSNRTFLNQPLAEHYGIRGVKGGDFRMVVLPHDSPRGGLLTMAATLTVTSHATRTSPVKRGDFVLAQLMGNAPPPPPPDVPPLEQATDKLGKDATLREQLAAHVADPNCAVCHKRLDPIGLAMENFSAIGAWRDTEQGKPIDASGQLPGGKAFNGPTELKQVMLERKDQFVENLCRQMLTYAIGRGTEPFDRPTIKELTVAVKIGGSRMQPLIEAVVLSDAFRKARGRETKP